MVLTLAVICLLRHDRSRCTKDLKERIGLRTGDPDVCLEIAPDSPCSDGCGPGGRGRWLHPDGQARIRRGVAQLAGDQRAAAAVLAKPAAGSAAVHPTTVTTIGQAYYCVFAHYYAGPVLVDRVLLAAAFAGFTQELDRLGMDQPHATMPALTGNRDRDWTAFAAVYQNLTSELPASPDQRQELAAATMTSMIASLHDNHARWSYPAPPPGDVPGDLGIMTSPAYPLTVPRRTRRCRRCSSPRCCRDPPPPATGCGPGTSSSPSTARRRSPTASSLRGQ